ncbi:MAG: cytochrome c [Acidobacteriia bacterium]|nr:cytochrome c [Terriglobia bacterium]
MKRDLIWLAVAALTLASAALAESSAAQGGAKKPARANSAEAVQRGKALFDKKCGVCHYPTSEERKIGPGLKGLNKRGVFGVTGGKITDDSLKTWIENGDNLMPPFKDVLGADEIKDVVRYVRTL